MKFLSRFASPAGFALVLLLFLLLPFVSVSCEVPGYGDAGATYTGSHLVSGVDPEVPPEMMKLVDDPESPGVLVDPPDPGVQPLAILLAVLALAGVATVFLPSLKARLFGSAGLAAAALVVAIITMTASRSGLETAIIDSANKTGAVGDKDGPRLAEVVGQLVHTEVGFWLVAALLALIVVLATTLGLLGDRLQALLSNPDRHAKTGDLGSLSLGKHEH